MYIDFDINNYNTVQDFIDDIIWDNNNYRPSYALNYKTPIEYRTQLGFKLFFLSVYFLLTSSSLKISSFMFIYYLTSCFSGVFLFSAHHEFSISASEKNASFNCLTVAVYFLCKPNTSVYSSLLAPIDNKSCSK